MNLCVIAYVPDFVDNFIDRVTSGECNRKSRENKSA
jgi:hypothetical protein